jgi:ParB family chromosome partitioning protein
MNMQFRKIKIEDVVVKSRIREDVGDLDELANSINEIGLLSPILLDSHNCLLAGLRRFMACRNLGMMEIPALIVIADDPIQRFNIEVQENLCRKPLTSFEIDKEIDLKKKLFRRFYKKGNIIGRFFSAIPRVFSIMFRGK